jgi:hypothetical protein
MRSLSISYDIIEGMQGTISHGCTKLNGRARPAKAKPPGITTTGEGGLRNGWTAATSLNGSVEHAITGNTVKGTKTVCKQAHIALRAMKKHPRILNCTKSKERTHYLGQLPSNRSNAKEKASRSDRCRLGGPCERWLSIINVRGSSRGR